MKISLGKIKFKEAWNNVSSTNYPNCVIKYARNPNNNKIELAEAEFYCKHLSHVKSLGFLKDKLQDLDLPEVKSSKKGANYTG